jgi:pyruvate dehydrogenase E1 component alpha subunit
VAAAFGIGFTQVDGDDVEAVSELASRVVGELRGGSGPRFVESTTHRVRGHYEGDPQKYRDPGELEALPAHDPIARCARRLADLGAGAALLDQVARRVDAQIEAAVERARQAALPRFEAAQAGVYAVAREG